MKLIFLIVALYLLSTEAVAATDTNAYRERCANGHATSCQNLVREETYRLQKSALKVFLKDQCEKKNQTACAARARVLSSEGRYSEALQILEISCDAGTDESCIELASSLGQAGQKNVELSMKRESCERGSVRGCTTYGALLVERGEIDRGRVMFEKACAKDFAPACFNLASILSAKGRRLEAAAATAKRFSAARSSCDDGDLYSCASVAGTLTNPADQKSEYQKLCKTHVEIACKLLSRLEQELGNTKKAKDAEAEYRKIYWRQCEQSDGDACFALAGYFSGAQASKRRLYGEKAKKILSKNCEQGHVRSCSQIRELATSSSIAMKH